MNARIGKIARLPYQTREELNLRLLNGELGAPLLKWLNELPDTMEILAKLFGGKPITKQNLSEWRHGGYQDWLRHQHRREGFQQMTEQGQELEEDEGADPFENFSRLVIAEMAEDLNALHELSDRNERWKRLREISRDLARLQHSYNHSRKVELSFLKWNYKLGVEDDQFAQEEEQEQQSEVPKIVTDPRNTQNAPRTTPMTVAPGPTESQQKNSPTEDRFRNIYHRRCGYDCICKDCHPDDGKYPYAQAVKDYEESMKPGYWAAGKVRHPMIMNFDCDCYCGCAKSVAWEKQVALGQLPPGAVPIPGSTVVRPATRAPAHAQPSTP